MGSVHPMAGTTSLWSSANIVSRSSGVNIIGIVFIQFRGKGTKKVKSERMKSEK
jgi:hypothetical protein